MSLLRPADVLHAVHPLVGRQVRGLFLAGERTTVGMDGCLASAALEPAQAPRTGEMLRLSFEDETGYEVGWLGVPLADVEVAEVRDQTVSLDLGLGDCVLLALAEED